MSRGANLLHLIRRRWYVFLAALAMAAVAMYAANSTPRVHTAEVLVTLEPPVEATLSEQWVDYTETLVIYSEVIERAVALGHPESVALSSPKATHYGNGIREGVSVTLLATGNQWVKQLDRPVLVVSVSSPDEQQTLTGLGSLARAISDISDRVQAEAGIPPEARITAEWSDEEYSVGSYGWSRQGTVKGAVAIAGGASVIAAMIAYLTLPPRSGRPDGGRRRDHPARTGRPGSSPRDDRQWAPRDTSRNPPVTSTVAP